MKKSVCYLFIFDGFSDWEPALAIANLRTHFKYTITSFSIDGKPIRSAGNLQIQPDCSMKEVDAEKADILLLPGGTIWESANQPDIKKVIEQFLQANKPVAAICGATIFMANNGYLDAIPHTSNGLEYLKKYAPNYKGEKHYQQQPCVTAGNIITANGAAMIEFATAVYNKLQVEEPEFLEKINVLYKSSGMDYRL
jgi:putative intracellular protease/amidase